MKPSAQTKNVFHQRRRFLCLTWSMELTRNLIIKNRLVQVRNIQYEKLYFIQFQFETFIYYLSKLYFTLEKLMNIMNRRKELVLFAKIKMFLLILKQRASLTHILQFYKTLLKYMKNTFFWIFIHSTIILMLKTMKGSGQVGLKTMMPLLVGLSPRQATQTLLMQT